MSAPYFNNIKDKKIPSTSTDALSLLTQICGKSADLNNISISFGKLNCIVLSIEGMASIQLMAELIFQPLTEFASAERTAEEVKNFLSKSSIMSSDRQFVSDVNTILKLLFSGFAVILIDGSTEAVCLGIQGFEKRSVSLPETEQTVGGARDSFNEALRVNMSLIRRRLKTPALRFKLLQVGKLSNTDISIAYIEGRCDPEALDRTQQYLMSVKLDTVLNSGYLMTFIDHSYNTSVFSAVMVTERPDTACAALNEGKILVLTDGSPACMILPTVFADNFRTMDDYCEKPYFAAFSRWIKYLAFVLAVMLPGLYAALVMFHPEVFPLKLLLNLSAAEEATPYPLVVEMTLLMVLFEIMREAGVRLPKAVGGAVSIVGGLIIGDAAVKSGIVSQPLLIVVGITATASFVLPSLYPAVSVLRIIFIIAGGLGGIYGMTLASCLLAVNISSVNLCRTPYTSPLSPLRPHGIRDLFLRADFHDLQKTRTAISPDNSPA
ncbi:spore germination protein [uncultured Ruminococcus sp.]|uniref:spore germination protein n=1 Tax=uncultured Ruminococcus sp. TaxID=165186 RepID=UPI0025F68CDC|nr:spore germination protein [uncultured Ruminococcus sp.]